MTESEVTEIVDTRPSLETERFALRPFSSEDEEAVFTICSEKEIAANTRTIPHPYPREQASHWIKQHPELWQQGKAAIFAICEKSSAELVGAVGLEINESDQNAELGYWIDKKRWGEGICTEASKEVLRFGFETLSLNKIHAHYITSNPASGRVMEKIGLKSEGLLRGHIRKWGQFYDVSWYGLLKSDFEEQQTG